MADFQLGYSPVTLDGFTPTLPFLQIGGPVLDASDVLSRADTVWRFLGPVVGFTGPGGVFSVLQSEYLVYGQGLGTGPGLLPTQGTVTDIVWYYNLITPGPVFSGLFVERVFDIIRGINAPAADFASAVLDGTAASFLTAGNDLFRDDEIGSPFLTETGQTYALGRGDDTIHGPGNTTVTIYGGEGDDSIFLPRGASSPLVGLGALLDGEAGDDFIQAGDAYDLLRGGEGSDRLEGGVGNDTLNGGLDRDRLRGEAGDDLLIANIGELEPGEVLDGGTGTDRLFLGHAPGQVFDITLAQIMGIEHLESSGDLLLTRAQFAGFSRIDFGGFSTITFADAGFTELVGRTFYSFSPLATLTLRGTSEQDIINGRDSFDVGPPIPGLFATGAGDILEGLGGNDVLNGGGGNDVLRGGEGNDTLRGESGVDRLEGGLGNDLLDSGSNPNAPFAGPNDTLDGGAGNDSYVVRHFNTTLVELAGGGVDTVIAHVSLTLLDQFENLTIGGTAAVNGWGNGVNNTMRGNEARNSLSGEGGNDNIQGFGGNDSLIGGEGNDQLFGGADNDLLFGGIGSDILRGDAGNDTLIGNEGNDQLFGGAGADSMDGGDGQDFVSYAEATGAIGLDLLVGGTSGEALGDSFFSIERFIGSEFEDAMWGGAGDDRLEGESGQDALFGREGADQLFGGKGDDEITGGAGRDRLTGGEGRDTFVFLPGDTGTTAATRDQILDWNAGDWIGLVKYDGDLDLAGIQPLAFIGAAAFTGLGQVRAVISGTLTFVEINNSAANGNGADAVIEIRPAVTLTAADFLL